MRAAAFVLLAVASAYAEADADAYTIGQVNHGFTHGGIITGVDYGHNLVSGVGAIGNRYAVPVATHATYAGPYSAGVYSGIHGAYNGVYGAGVHGVYGKREAEADAEADPYFYNGVYGTGVHTAGVYGAGVYGHHAGVVSTHAAVVPTVHSTVAAVPAVRTVIPTVHSTVAGIPAVSTINHVAAIPAVHSTVAAVPTVHAGVYSGIHGVSSLYNHGAYGVYGKREAEADAEADPYFYNGVYGTGVHTAGVYGAGVYGHHAGVVSTHAAVVPAVHSTIAAIPAVRTVIPTVHSTVAGIPAVSTINNVAAIPAVHTGVYSGIHGVSSLYNHGAYGVYGKREAEADAEAEPYTIGQVAHGLPIHNAYATGHPHNVGYTRYVSSSPYVGHVGYTGHYFG